MTADSHPLSGHQKYQIPIIQVAETELMQPAVVSSEIVQAANETETSQTVNTTEILRHRPHLVPTKGIDQ